MKNRNSATMSTTNSRLAASVRTSISGESVRVCPTTNRARTARPATIEPIVAGEPQPQTVDCCRPRTSRVIPTTMRTAPGQSTFPG